MTRLAEEVAAAYGVAVTGTMAITTYLFYLVAQTRWQWSRRKALAFLVPFLAIDVAFLAANSVKIADGGWFPLAVGVVVFAIMTTWFRGRTGASAPGKTATDATSVQCATARAASCRADPTGTAMRNCLPMRNGRSSSTS